MGKTDNSSIIVQSYARETVLCQRWRRKDNDHARQGVLGERSPDLTVRFRLSYLKKEGIPGQTSSTWHGPTVQGEHGVFGPLNMVYPGCRIECEGEKRCAKWWSFVDLQRILALLRRLVWIKRGTNKGFKYNSDMIIFVLYQEQAGCKKENELEGGHNGRKRPLSWVLK